MVSAYHLPPVPIVAARLIAMQRWVVLIAISTMSATKVWWIAKNSMLDTRAFMTEPQSMNDRPT